MIRRDLIVAVFFLPQSKRLRPRALGDIELAAKRDVVSDLEEIGDRPRELLAIGAPNDVCSANLGLLFLRVKEDAALADVLRANFQNLLGSVNPTATY